eukprot:GHVT01075938.1.p1 GENE.GHVT01075938.1~~GHVT01075938.1.p1  ORF type:complete len:847 (+),score=58.33 GHVT01075938.1:395-2935(+)
MFAPSPPGLQSALPSSPRRPTVYFSSFSISLQSTWWSVFDFFVYVPFSDVLQMDNHGKTSSCVASGALCNPPPISSVGSSTYPPFTFDILLQFIAKMLKNNSFPDSIMAPGWSGNGGFELITKRFFIRKMNGAEFFSACDEVTSTKKLYDRFPWLIWITGDGSSWMNLPTYSKARGNGPILHVGLFWPVYGQGKVLQHIFSEGDLHDTWLTKEIDKSLGHRLIGKFQPEEVPGGNSPCEKYKAWHAARFPEATFSPAQADGHKAEQLHFKNGLSKLPPPEGLLCKTPYQFCASSVTEKVGDRSASHLKLRKKRMADPASNVVNQNAINIWDRLVNAIAFRLQPSEEPMLELLVKQAGAKFVPAPLLPDIPTVCYNLQSVNNLETLQKYSPWLLHVFGVNGQPVFFDEKTNINDFPDNSEVFLNWPTPSVEKVAIATFLGTVKELKTMQNPAELSIGQRITRQPLPSTDPSSIPAAQTTAAKRRKAGPASNAMKRNALNIWDRLIIGIGFRLQQSDRETTNLLADWADARYLQAPLLPDNRSSICTGLQSVNSLETLKEKLPWLLHVAEKNSLPVFLDERTNLDSFPDHARVFLNWPTHQTKTKIAIATPLGTVEELKTMQKPPADSIMQLISLLPLPSTSPSSIPAAQGAASSMVARLEPPSASGKVAHRCILLEEQGYKCLGTVVECTPSNSRRLDDGDEVVGGAVVKGAFNRRIECDSNGNKFECFDYYPASVQGRAEELFAVRAVTAHPQESRVEDRDPLGGSALAGLAAAGTFLTVGFVLVLLWGRFRRKSRSSAQRQKKIGAGKHQQFVTDLDGQATAKPKPKFRTRLGRKLSTLLTCLKN